MHQRPLDLIVHQMISCCKVGAAPGRTRSWGQSLLSATVPVSLLQASAGGPLALGNSSSMKGGKANFEKLKYFTECLFCALALESSCEYE